MKTSLCFQLAGLLGLALVSAVSARAVTPDPVYHLPAPPMELMTNEEKFVPFAQTVKAEVDRMLAAKPDPAREKLLLGLRVHLAHHFGENEVALKMAARIQALTSDPADKAFAGLTTKAAAVARASTGENAGSPRYGAVFRREFAAQLAQLPKTPEIAAMLKKQREKNAGISRDALLQEVKDKIAPAIARRGSATLEEVDQLVRARHRLTDILPVRGETLQALDQAIAERSPS